MKFDANKKQKKREKSFFIEPFANQWNFSFVCVVMILLMLWFDVIGIIFFFFFVDHKFLSHNYSISVHKKKCVQMFFVPKYLWFQFRDGLLPNHERWWHQTSEFRELCCCVWRRNIESAIGKWIMINIPCVQNVKNNCFK